MKNQNMKYKQYSVVRVKEIRKQFNEDDMAFMKRVPVIGDVATIIEIYEKPTLGYELECSDKNGITEWMVTFAPDEVELQLVDSTNG